MRKLQRFKSSDIERLLQRTPQKSNKSALVIAVSVLVVLGLVAVYFTMGSRLVSEDVFIERANACQPAVFEKTIGTATMRLESKRGCVLEKTIIAMDESEPVEVRNLFIGAQMTCEYQQGAFDTRYVMQISGDLGSCQGSLVDAVLAVV